MATKLDVVFPLYPGVSFLDFMGPQAVFGLLPGARQIFASVGGQPIREGALTLQPLTRLEDVERCDVLCVPGGPLGGRWRTRSSWRACAGWRPRRASSPRCARARSSWARRGC
ncbi:hypothetical protein ACN28S_57945 [Cystobacter fuscus]